MITGTFGMHMVTITHSQTHKDIIIHSQSSTSVSSVMTKPSPNVDGPSNIKSQLTSLYVCRDNNEKKTTDIVNFNYYYYKFIYLPLLIPSFELLVDVKQQKRTPPKMVVV